MTWIKLDNKAPRHPKVAGLSDRAFRVWIQTLCLASEFLTDGILPAAFLRDVPTNVRAEIVAAGLWVMDGDVVAIHDFLGHQTSRRSVERERERNRKRAEYRRYLHRSPGGTPAVVPQPDVDTDTDGDVPAAVAAGTRQQQPKAPSLIRSPLAFSQAEERCAFVGCRLEVPKKFHADLVRDTGGADADGRLRAWYSTVDEEIERTGEAIVPDIYKWLTARWRSWATGARVSTVPNADESRRMRDAIRARAGQ